MKKLLLLFLCTNLLFLTSCSVEPEKINYGSDACHFCQMTIVDKQHSAQYVTEKGKQFKYDAIECMLNEFSEMEMDGISTILVADYGNPGSMTNAKTATYLISKEIRSPMGAFLSAFSLEKNNKVPFFSDEDKIYSWPGIKEKYDVK